MVFFFSGESRKLSSRGGFSGEQKTGQPWGFFCGAEIRGAVVCFSGAENRGSLA